MTIGIFDGVHRGHRVLIDRIVRHDDCSVPVVITFKQNHKKANKERGYMGDLSSFRQKSALMENLGVALILIIDFSESFRRLSGLEFFRLLAEYGNIGFFAVGSNFRCGYQLDTDAQAIQRINAQRGIPTDIVEVLMESSHPISSSRIRSAIAGGNLREAAAMLGYNYTADISDALAPSGSPDLIWDIASRGRLLPPPGSYPALLHSSGGGFNQSPLHTEALIEGGMLRIPGAFAKNHRDINWEYLEFLAV